ncbi:MAG: formyltransferase family protein [Inquilinaceae bacterium]
MPAYRGIGGYTYAIGERRRYFGVTSHHIVERIDFGSIIKVVRFPILPNETVPSLQERTASYCLILFFEIVHLLTNGRELPQSDEPWGAKLYTHAMLERYDAETRSERVELAQSA